MNAIPCGLLMPTRNGVICPLARLLVGLRVPTKLMTPASLGDDDTGEPGTHVLEQTEKTPEELSAISRQPFEDVGQIVSSICVPTVTYLTVWDEVPIPWMNSRLLSP